jgi:hypothetical protein
LHFTGIPDSLILDGASKTGIDIRLRASGFQFLGMQFRSRRLAISLAEVRKGPRGYYLPRQLFLSQIERQLPGSIDLVEVDNDTLYFRFLGVHSKKVPVVPEVNMELDQNYLLEGEVSLQPDSIVLRGPGNIIDTMGRVYTRPISLRQVREDFNLEVALDIPEHLQHISLSDSTVRISGKVFRFSEKIIQVPLHVLHLPEGTEIKTFPSEIPILCKARVEELKDLNPSDFRLIANYDSLKKGQQYLDVQLLDKPDAVHSAQLLEEKVEFILKREQ